MEEYCDGLSLLPENCLSEIISKTSIKDACRLSAVSLAFNSASESDSVWDKFFASDYQQIISKSDSQFNFSTKKELFFRLCDSGILINGGTMGIRLCKTSGKKCYMMRARDLTITGKDDPTIWMWKSCPQSRFSEAATLLPIYWFDIQGTIEARFLSHKTTYAAYFVYNVDYNPRGLEAVTKAKVKYISDDEYAKADRYWNRVYLMPLSISYEHIIAIDGHVSQKRMDGWRFILENSITTKERV